MKVILTGATGYLGSLLAKKFVNKDVEVLCIKRKSSSLEKLDEIIDNIVLVDEDATNLDQVLKSFNAEFIIHTACAYDRNGISEDEIIEANFNFPLKLLKKSRELGIKKWVNTGTALNRDCNAYTLSKWQFCEWGKLYSERYEIDFYNIELQHFYGIGDSESKFITWLIKQLKENKEIELTDGMQKRDFIYIDDVIEAYWALIESELRGYHDIGLGSGQAPSIREVVEYLMENIGTTSSVKFGAISKRRNEPEICVADIEKLNKLGWKVKYTWQEGMLKLL